jgi:hypothetical protein
MLGLLLVLLAQINPAAKPPPIAEVTPRTKAILAKLEEPVDMVLEVPLDAVLQGIKRASKKGPNDPGLPIYVDPLGLQRAERSLNSMVTITADFISPRDRLERALTSLRMAYIVKDDVLIISDPRGIERERHEVAVRACDASPASQALLARLEEPVRIPFPNETPLDDVLAYLKRATAQPPHDRAIKILVVPDGLKEVERSLNSTIQVDFPRPARPPLPFRVERSLNSTIQVDLEGVPLKTTLRLLLDQLGLGCVVKDGRLVIHSRQGIRKLIRAAEELERQPRTRSSVNDAPAGRAVPGGS